MWHNRCALPVLLTESEPFETSSNNWYLTKFFESDDVW